MSHNLIFILGAFIGFMSCCSTLLLIELYVSLKSAKTISKKTVNFMLDGNM